MPDRAQPAVLHRILADKRWAISISALAVLLMLACGYFGVGRGGVDPGMDLRFLWAAGHAWLEGKNPYVLSELNAATPEWIGLDFVELGHGFAYPPQSSALCILMGAMSWTSALWGMHAINLLSTAALIWACVRLGSSRDKQTPGLTYAAVALVCASPFTQHVAYMGQTSLLVSALLASGFYFAHRKVHIVLPAALLAGATMKPHLALLPMLWLLAERKLALCLLTGAFSLLLCLPAFLLHGPLETVQTWLASMALYQAGGVQVAGFQHVFSIQSLLVSAGLHVPMLWPLALGTVVWMRRFRGSLSELDTLGMTVAASFLFMYAHDYDLAALAPLLVALWVHSTYRPRAELAAAVGVLLLFTPQRFLRALQAPDVLLHWREIVVLAMLAGLIWNARKSGRQQGVAQPSPQPGAAAESDDGVPSIGLFASSLEAGASPGSAPLSTARHTEIP